MAGLARPAEELGSAYDAVIVGSGYGGGVAASRLSRLGLKVAVLERGREFLPGDFPTTLLGTQREFQASWGRKRLGSPTALFDMRLGPDIQAVVGCGVGGTSLINANVCLAPDSLVFEDQIWPQSVRTDHYLNLGFHRARQMLSPEPLPETSIPLKLKALEKAGQALARHVERVPLHIAFADKQSTGGVKQFACTQCGDCMSGCNVGAKTTVHSTYLADAVRSGAKIFKECCVRYVERAQNGDWRIAIANLGTDARVPLRTVTASIVVIAAGTLGSNEILLRSRDRGLSISSRLGKAVSTNADAIAFGYNNNIPINAIGTGASKKTISPPPGPAVTGLIDMRRRKDSLDRIALVEASVQSSMARLLPMLLPMGALLGTNMDTGIGDLLADLKRTGESLVAGAYRGAVHNTQIFLAVAHDSASGEITLEGDHISIRWPGAKDEPVFAHIEQVFKTAIAATGGTYIPNPVSTRFMGGKLMTVHPLGGCAMADDRTRGVVDHKSRVFDADPKQHPSAVHQGLYVCDGSIMPRSLGVHPLLSITAFAERAMHLLSRDLETLLPNRSLNAASS